MSVVGRDPGSWAVYICGGGGVRKGLTLLLAAAHVDKREDLTKEALTDDGWCVEGAGFLSYTRALTVADWTRLLPFSAANWNRFLTGDIGQWNEVTGFFFLVIVTGAGR